MGFLSVPQVQKIRECMIEDDITTLQRKYKSKKNPKDTRSVELNEVEELKKNGWEVVVYLKKKAKMQRDKDCGRRFEDEIWCMFYELGFRTLNLDENLVVQWGPNPSDHKQLDVVAVGEDAIFVVECKAADKRKNGSFKKDIDNIIQQKEGLTKALRQLYGEKKRVKFIFATRNYTFSDTSEDLKRLKDNNIYHFNENSYDYVCNLIDKYKESVIYQFYGLMFKNEKISSEPIRVPALRGSMGGHDYYMLSIEPSKLLKIGFVLHRTKVNDSMAPTYQRLLIPKRLKGIRAFIDGGGYFPNSIIINFESNKKNKIIFEPSGKSEGFKSNIGYLSIPNAYGIAYIIDGQHRVYGYAGSLYKETNTIPVVAFCDLKSDEQLRIFMDINENQKEVSPTLRLDLEEDLNWKSERVDSRLRALRSSIIKALANDSNSILFNKIAVGEDSGKLTFLPFENALMKTSLLPKATQKSYTKYTNVCMYDCNNLDYDKAMNDSKKRISNYIRDCYGYMNDKLEEDVYSTFIECNRGTFGFIAFVGSLNEYLVTCEKLQQNSSTKEQMNCTEPYLDVLANYLSTMSSEDKTTLLVSKGQGADTIWLRMFQGAVNKVFPDYVPEGLEEWKETQDKDLQEEGKTIGNQIEEIIHNRIIEKLKQHYGAKWEDSIIAIKGKCLQRLGEMNEDVDIDDWTVYLEVSDYQEIIDKQWLLRKEGDDSFVPFEKDFAINIGENFKSKKDKMKWLSDFITLRKSWTTAKGKPLNRSQINELRIILQSLQPAD